MIWRTSVVLVCVALGSTLAVAKPADPIERAAREHAALGAALYKVERYDDAIREWWAGYALVPLPRFLINIGNAHVRQHQPAKAIELFTRFLAEAPRDDPDRAAVQSLIAEQRVLLPKAPPPAAVAAAPPAPTATKPPPATTPPPPAPAATPATATPTAAPELVDKAPPPRPSWWRRHWWTIPVGTVAAAGLAVGLGVGLTASHGCAAPGCYDLTSTP